jgi:YHS domain-containing protein
MKTLHAVAVMAVVLGAVGLFAAGCQKTEPQAPAPAAAGHPKIAQKMCPVMGGPIDPNIYTDYNGRRIYFCCTSCPKVFEKDPEKYVAKVDEQLKTAGETR